MSDREKLWWERVGRALAVGGIVYLLIVAGLSAPWGAYVLLIGLFFGPDVYRQFGPGKGSP